MRDLILKIDKWFREGEKVVLATVVKTWGSSPNPIGSQMFITGSGRFLGSVSGGCVEGAVIWSLSPGDGPIFRLVTRFC